MALARSVIDPILTPLYALDENLDLLTALRMERMRDPDRRGQLLGARSSTFIDRTPAEVASSGTTSARSDECPASTPR